MNKKKLHKILEFVKYFAMITVIICGVYVLFFSKSNFCVETQGRVDIEDEGKRCFKTLEQANDYKLYLINKYNINENNLGINIPFNISE